MIIRHLDPRVITRITPEGPSSPYLWVLIHKKALKSCNRERLDPLGQGLGFRIHKGNDAGTKGLGFRMEELRCRTGGQDGGSM